MKKIFIIGTFNGWNIGDNAIIASMIADFKENLKDIKIFLPTRNASFIEKEYLAKYNIEPIHLTLKNSTLGLPRLILKIINAIYNSNVVIVTQSLLFDFKLFNIKHNIILIILMLSLLARIFRRPMGYYNATVGPINTKIGMLIIGYISNHLNFIILRDIKSKEILSELGVTKPPLYVTADAAYNAIPISSEAAHDILYINGVDTTKLLIGLSVNYAVDSWMKEAMNNYNPRNMLADLADELIDELGAEVIFIVSDLDDVEFTKSCIKVMKNRKKAKCISNEKYDYPEIMGILGEMDLFIGMRLHPIIFATTMNTPSIALVYMDKMRSFMRMMHQEKWMIEFNSELTHRDIASKTKKLLSQKEEASSDLKIIIADLQRQAHNSAIILKEYMDK